MADKGEGPVFSVTDCLTTSGSGLVQIRVPKSVVWRPLPDITAFELAQALPVLFSQGRISYQEDTIAAMPLGVQRHFEVN